MNKEQSVWLALHKVNEIYKHSCNIPAGTQFPAWRRCWEGNIHATSRLAHNSLHGDVAGKEEHKNLTTFVYRPKISLQFLIGKISELFDFFRNQLFKNSC
ncbi:MAG: hypothetical protein JST17_14035 [Bacteroidetes bacterium]|nr:hypothetical protein [Bacteroidota bacterium]